MASIEQLKGSDGSGNANVATIQNIRSPGASTIIVDTVLGINPGGFAGSMGTPHTFTDPITSEVITVISEATAVDFTGHVDGGNLEIDDIAPGYVDGGSEVGDIVIIRPTTQWSDNLGEVLEASHDDDGTLKAGAVDNAAVLAADVVTTAKILDDNVTAPKIVGVDKSNLTTDSNPYKFSVYRTGAQNVGTGSTKVLYDTENFDTNNNYDNSTNYRYTAPVSGFYQFNAIVSTNTAGAGTSVSISLYKNGALILAGDSEEAGAGTAPHANVGGLVQLAANDYIEVFVGSGTAAKALDVSSSANNVFTGFLVCRT